VVLMRRGLTDILGKGDFFIVIVDYFVHRPSLSNFGFSKSVAAHGVVAGGFLPVAFPLVHCSWHLCGHILSLRIRGSNSNRLDGVGV
jgi:hypothetical protein